MAVVGACPCAISLDHFDFRLFVGSYSQNEDEFTFSFISRRKFIYFSRKLFGFGAYAVLLIIWSAVMEYWQYFRVQFIFQ